MYNSYVFVHTYTCNNIYHVLYMFLTQLVTPGRFPPKNTHRKPPSSRVRPCDWNHWPGGLSIVGFSLFRATIFVAELFCKKRVIATVINMESIDNCSTSTEIEFLPVQQALSSKLSIFHPNFWLQRLGSSMFFFQVHIMVSTKHPGIKGIWLSPTFNHVHFLRDDPIQFHVLYSGIIS